MNSNESLNVIKLNIARVHDTIKNILLVKKQLQNNSLEAKGDVHSSISRQLEALRSREVWLLDQVDTIQHIKEGILDEQLCHLQHELGAARTFLATAVGNSSLCTEQLQATVANLELLNFEPKEDSDIHFSADQKHLRDTVYAFGHIQTNKRRIVDTEGTGKKACLSDVREVDHGELYRSLTELKEKKDKCLDAVPAWALQNQEWLIKTPNNTPAEPYSDLLFPPFRKSASLTEWLQKVQEVTEVRSLRDVEEDDEDDDDYHMAESDVLSFEMISTAHEETELPGVHPYFDQILTSPTKEWLQNPERIRLEYEMGASYPYSVMRYFREVSKDTRVWLAGYEERKKLEEVEEKNKEMMMSCAGQCACTATSPIVQTIEIENLDHLVCMREPTTKSTSLQQRVIEEEDDIMMLPDIEKVCRANETCGSFSECVCDTKCCKGFPESESVHSSEWSIPEVKNQSHWLSKAADKNASEAPNFPYFQRVRSENNGDWLLCTDSQASEPSSCVSPMKSYLATRPDKDSDWLSSKEQKSEKFICDDSWLAKKEKAAEEVCPESGVWKTVQKHHSCYNTTDWLNSSCQRSTSSKINQKQFDTWRTVIDHHSNYTEADWRLPSTEPHERTKQTPLCIPPDVENKEYENWLMSRTKGSEELKKCAGQRKNTQTKVSDWLLGTIPDDIRGIVSKMDEVHLTTPPTKWLLCDQPKNTVKEKMSESDITHNFPCFAEKSPIKSWLKE